MNSFLNIVGNSETPSVQMSPGKILISGRSTLKNPEEFFITVINYLKYYNDTPQKLDISFALEYYNAISLAYMSRIFSLIESISEKAVVKVLWYSYEDDDNIKELGELYDEMYKVDIQLITLSAPPKHKPLFKFI